MTTIRSITVPFSKSQIINLEESDWEGIQELVKEPTSIMIYEHEDKARVLLALGACLNSEGTGIIRMHVYHTCQDDPVILQSFESGFAEGNCPMCHNTFCEDDVEYDLELIVKYNIKLED